MKIKPTRKKTEKLGPNFHCGRCGKVVPFEKKWLTHYFQGKLTNINRWVVHIGFICPYCATPTSVIVVSRKSQHAMIEKINLYGEYAKS